MENKILLIGGGGHCKSIIDSLQNPNQYDGIGIIDKKENIGNELSGIKIIGCDDDLAALHQQGYHYAFMSLGSIGDSSNRVRLFTMIEKLGFIIPNIIDPSAILSNSVNLEHGIYIGKHAVINAGATIGKGSIINTSAVIEHDCTVQMFAHIAPGVILCGDVNIGEHTHIGAGSVIRQQVKVGRSTIIGMGSVVIHDIGDSVLAYGNPCKEVKTL